MYIQSLIGFLCQGFAWIVALLIVHAMAYYSLRYPFETLQRMNKIPKEEVYDPADDEHFYRVKSTQATGLVALIIAMLADSMILYGIWEIVSAKLGLR